MIRSSSSGPTPQTRAVAVFLVVRNRLALWNDRHRHKSPGSQKNSAAGYISARFCSTTKRNPSLEAVWGAPDRSSKQMTSLLRRCRFCAIGHSVDFVLAGADERNHPGGPIAICRASGTKACPMCKPYGSLIFSRLFLIASALGPVCRAVVLGAFSPKPKQPRNSIAIGIVHIDRIYAKPRTFACILVCSMYWTLTTYREYRYQGWWERFCSHRTAPHLRWGIDPT